MSRSDARRLLQRFFALTVLTTCFIFIYFADLNVKAFRPQCPIGECPPGVFCVPPNSACGSCWAPPRIIEGSCTDIGNLCTCAFTCSGVCKPLGGGGNCESAEVPFCQGNQIAVCIGNTYVCDDPTPFNDPTASCSGQHIPFQCTSGAICYNGEWHCGNNSCSGTPPLCPDPSSSGMIPGVCFNGVWLCGGHPF